MYHRLRKHNIPRHLVPLLLISAALATLAFTVTGNRPGCTHAQGRLFNATELGGPGRMIGTISGTYWYDITTYEEWDIDDTDVIFNSGSSLVEGKRGTITFKEYAALDTAEQEGFNGAVLLVVTGGTGKWQDASGHIALSGYFHGDTTEGKWDYQGEICVP